MGTLSQPEFSSTEKELLASLEPRIRRAVWNDSAKIFEGPYESEGKWIEYPLRLPGKKDDWGKYTRVTLTRESSSEDFTECYCAFGTNRLHTGVAVYRILRELKRRGLLNHPGFENNQV